MKKLCLNKWMVIALAVVSTGVSAGAHESKGDNSAVIEFKKGQDMLTQSAKEKLGQLIDREKKAGQIASVEVAVWSDQPFPARNQSLSDTDVNLAGSRADTVEVYLKDSLRVSEVTTYNMAEGYNWLSKAFNTDDAELKSVFAKENSPALARRDFDTIRSEGAPSKAVVVVTMKEPMK